MFREYVKFVALLPPPRQEDYVFLGVSYLVCLFVTRIALELFNYFHKILWKGGTWATETPLDFDGNPDLDLDQEF